MRSLALVTIACLAVSPVSAQEAEGEPAPEEGLSLIEEGARMFLEGLAEDMAPAMKDLAELAESWQPQMREFVTQMRRRAAGRSRGGDLGPARDHDGAARVAAGSPRTLSV